MKVCIGIDVGGTNTDAVVLYHRHIVAKCKHPTTLDVTLGVQTALSTVLGQLSANFPDRNVLVGRVNIGTTHFLNAVLQRKDLAPVAVIRLCGPASRALPPFCDFPSDLKEVLCAGYYFVDGGYEFDGEEIKSVRREEVLHVISQLKREGKDLFQNGRCAVKCKWAATTLNQGNIERKFKLGANTVGRKFKLGGI